MAFFVLHGTFASCLHSNLFNNNNNYNKKTRRFNSRRWQLTVWRGRRLKNEKKRNLLFAQICSKHAGFCKAMIWSVDGLCKYSYFSPHPSFSLPTQTSFETWTVWGKWNKGKKVKKRSPLFSFPAPPQFPHQKISETKYAFIYFLLVSKNLARLPNL